ncbi:efflux RND transporter periplasmic adaptor subunit [Actinomadura craniellae]|uniref:Efflux RND transporter periplasmic adaptor subunit n=1 Tax=Actinomadura craniellae TaxID=2231787 RepID=A0A365HDQ2_9ACTN|nr:peptidoglycan-binding protein [Actinomadura craniellae]RAY17254.1 efflux RND transporter periplasmic adaptor subunit [Actinomadura craniellae]
MRRIRPRTVALATGGAVVLGGAGLVAVGVGGGADAAPARGALPPATADVVRTTLTDTEQVDGTLGYGEPRTATGAGGGMLTWLPAEGGAVGRGEPAYRVDGEAVPLLYGSLPVYRALRPGVSGSDVKQLERNLSALGYTGFTVDDDYTSGTADAVRSWQDDLGLPETGTVTRALVAPGRIRVGEHKRATGDPAGGVLYTYTGTTRVVVVDLDVKDQRLAERGATATVELPDGKTTEGKITRIGTVATKAGQDSDVSTVEVTITVADQKALGGLDQAPVDVHLAAERRQNVLAVPVAALLALPEGGYGVQVVAGGGTRTIEVEVGMFAAGRVEVSGAGLAAGMKVGVPR